MTDDTITQIAAEIERLNETVDRLQELGEAAELPAVERNATRIQGVAGALADNVPPELLEE